MKRKAAWLPLPRPKAASEPRGSSLLCSLFSFHRLSHILLKDQTFESVSITMTFLYAELSVALLFPLVCPSPGLQGLL